jgi:NADH-quinone oxidoreductase subunit C
MSQKLDTLQAALESVLGDKIKRLVRDRGELSLTVAPELYLEVSRTLRDHEALKFEQLLDLAGMDYSTYRDGEYEGPRFAAVSHLLSVTHNWRLRLKAFAADDELPVLASVTEVWSSANWYEREAFDLYGIIFDGHEDLRRLLTDYGFIGHPFRKDFPVYGNVEMRYDEAQKRVIYQPVTIEPREIVPRVIREDNYGGLH